MRAWPGSHINNSPTATPIVHWCNRATKTTTKWAGGRLRQPQRGCKNSFVSALSYLGRPKSSKMPHWSWEGTLVKVEYQIFFQIGGTQKAHFDIQRINVCASVQKAFHKTLFFFLTTTLPLIADSFLCWYFTWKFQNCIFNKNFKFLWFRCFIRHWDKEL